LLVTYMNLVICPAAMQTYFTHTYGSHSSGLFGDSADFMGLKQLYVSRNILFGTPSSWGFNNKKISDNAYKYFDFPTVTQNIYRVRTSIKQPLTGTSKTGRGRCVK